MILVIPGDDVVASISEEEVVSCQRLVSGEKAFRIVVRRRKRFRIFTKQSDLIFLEISLRLDSIVVVSVDVGGFHSYRHTFSQRHSAVVNPYTILPVVCRWLDAMQFCSRFCKLN